MKEEAVAAVAAAAGVRMEMYEDMFKEITRKLYGDDDKDSNDALKMVVTSSQFSSDDNSKKEDGQHSISSFSLNSLMDSSYSQMSSLQSSPFSSIDKLEDDRWISSEESLEWTTSKIASYNSVQKLFRCNECECVGYLSRVAEHWLGTHANLRVFQCPQCSYSSAWARCVRMHLARQHNVCQEQSETGMLWKESPVLEEVTKYLQRLKSKIEDEPEGEEHEQVVEEEPKQQPPTPTPELPVVPPQSPPPSPPPVIETKPAEVQTDSPKRYNCAFCHYATDRRDLYTRHENIHKEEKPFFCYVCLKQFNRADHIKKHFLRMHRDQPYDMNKAKRDNTTTRGSSFDPPPPAPPPQIIQQRIITTLEFVPSKPAAKIVEIEREVVRQPLNIPGFPVRIDGEAVVVKKPRKRPEKKYSCNYCSWTGVDNWVLKRHLNTHIKPFTCNMCEYKAARSERLALHVFKVHNKHLCSRCSFLADDQAALSAHQQAQHSL